MKRHSKLLPETFAKAMTLGPLDAKNITEEVIAEKCASIQTSVSLTKQAIQSRLKDSIPFLKELLKKTFSLIYSNVLDEHSSLSLKYFTDVKILDATTIALFLTSQICYFALVHSPEYASPLSNHHSPLL